MKTAPTKRGSLEHWPGGSRRDPSRSDRHYLVLAPLSRQIQSEVARLFDPSGRTLRVLDVGCGDKPYLPLLDAYAERYVGLDAAPRPHVDDVGSAEDLPYEDESFDLILCTQVREHLPEPAVALSEMHRVLRPGGSALISTHGVFLYHPDPPDGEGDYWRWTHSGLRRQVGAAGDWSEVAIQANGNVVACLAYIAAQYVDELGRRLPFDFPRRLMLRLLNGVAERLDGRFPPHARVPAPGSLSANYLLTATRA